jgi:hypothetical protein
MLSYVIFGQILYMQNNSFDKTVMTFKTSAFPIPILNLKNNLTTISNPYILHKTYSTIHPDWPVCSAPWPDMMRRISKCSKENVKTSPY